MIAIRQQPPAGADHDFRRNQRSQDFHPLLALVEFRHLRRVNRNHGFKMLRFVQLLWIPVSHVSNSLFDWMVRR
jgi:hypothetical protein